MGRTCSIYGNGSMRYVGKVFAMHPTKLVAPPGGRCWTLSRLRCCTVYVYFHFHSHFLSPPTILARQLRAGDDESHRKGGQRHKRAPPPSEIVVVVLANEMPEEPSQHPGHFIVIRAYGIYRSAMSLNLKRAQYPARAVSHQIRRNSFTFHTMECSLARVPWAGWSYPR